MIIIPADGIKIGNHSLRFKTWASLTDSSVAPKMDVDQYLAQLDSLALTGDSLANDSTTLTKIMREPGLTSIQFANNDPQCLWNFFEQCDSISSGKSVHIIHYGDSQIETDRISGVIRQSLQEKFGGYGPGLIAPVPVAASSNIVQNQSENWLRYTSYGYGEKVNHNGFGVMCSFGRFTPLKSLDKISTDSTDAWIELKPTRMGQARCKSYTNATLYIGVKNASCRLNLFVDDSLYSSEILATSSQCQIKKWHFDSTPLKIKFNFTSTDSPDVYAINLQGNSGIQLSNIALRGNDGGAFSRVNNTELVSTLSDLESKLIIMQFGGNAVPYLSGAAAAKAYGRGFKNHIRKIKSASSGAAIVVIGPSDMSTSINGEFQTWPYLEELSQGMKEAALEENCGFWDLYQVMGGKNSMISWVANNPPYAGPDYTHFTPLGARKIAELFYKALIEEYNHYEGLKNNL